MTDLIVLSDAEIRAVLGRREAVESQKRAYAAVSAGRVRAAGDTATSEPAEDTLVFALTGGIEDGETGIACKFGYQAPLNVGRGLPTVHAFVMLLDPVTGEQLACLNGTTVTTMRTAAGLGAAADALARPAASTLAVLGSGVQARETVAMVAAVRDLDGVRLWSPSAERREAAALELEAELGIAVVAADSPEAAVRGTDIVACCTTSREPVVEVSWLAPGATVLTMGSYQVDRREIALDCTRAATTIYVDGRGKATRTCGPVVEAIDAGVLTRGDVVEIGEVLAGRAMGRRDDEEILVFHSVGLGVQDASLGWEAYQRAVAQGAGQRVVL